ncbi:alpha/beta fold hydrolase [Mesorhizobium sp. M1078]|uniref:alpha/beta fold hydrolase n=1 Tax=Mesorhizobium sp. M1078 TaxID=2957055 RepID=UPI00333A2A45
MVSSLYVAERGAGPKTVVLLHGFGGCHDIWREVTASLGPDIRTLAYDLPGHGLSLEFPGSGPAKTAARAVLADIAARGIARVHVAGHSMGGAVASLMALAEPDRIGSLTLLAPGGAGSEINGPLLRRYAAAADRREIRACLAAMSGPRSPPPERIVGVLADLRRRPGQLRKLIEISAVMTRNERQGVIPGEQLDTLDMPVMVVWGTDDPVLPFTQADCLPAHFHIHHVLDAGHMLVEEVPDVVAQAVRRNMARRGRRLRPTFEAAAS